MTRACREAGLAAPLFEEIGTRFRVTLFTARVGAPVPEDTDRIIVDALAKSDGLLTSEIAKAIDVDARCPWMSWHLYVSRVFDPLGPRRWWCYLGVTAREGVRMASSTTLKLPDVLKGRVVDAARAVGMTPHAFMVDAIEQHTALAERRSALVGAALAAREEVATYGIVHDGDEVLSYLQERLKGGKPARPRKRKL